MTAVGKHGVYGPDMFRLIGGVPQGFNGPQWPYQTPEKEMAQTS